MKKRKNPQIKIGDVSGDVVISQDQQGGITSHSSSTEIVNQKKKTFFNNKIVRIIGLTAAILGILAYFGIQPSGSSNTELQNEYKIQKDNNPLAIVDTIFKKDTTIQANSIMKKNENKTEKEKPIIIGDVSGDAVISQNQSGGITAHTVNVNTDRNISQTVSDEISRVLKSSNCQITIGALGMGGETDKFANQLLKAAQNSGCVTSGVNHGIGFQVFNGLQIQVSQTNPLLEIARSLESILLNASIECSVVYNPGLVEGNIYLFVGYKP